MLALVVALVGLAAPLWIESAMPLIIELFGSLSEMVSGVIQSFGFQL